MKCGVTLLAKLRECGRATILVDNPDAVVWPKARNPERCLLFVNILDSVAEHYRLADGEFHLIDVQVGTKGRCWKAVFLIADG